jgi:DNA-binding NarL/FixJ family response regulator
MNARTTDNLPVLRMGKLSRPIGRSMKGWALAKRLPFPVRILLVDSAEVLRTGLRIILESDPALRVVAGCAALCDAHRLASQRHIHLMIMGHRFPDGDAFETCRAIRRQLPRLSVIFLADQWESTSLARAFEAGATDCLTKSFDRRQLVAAVRRATGARDDHPAQPISPAEMRIPDRTFQPKPPSAALSPRERQLVPLIVEGYTNKEIASLLTLTSKTVSNYLANLYRKLHLSRRVQVAALYGAHTGLFSKVAGRPAPDIDSHGR